MTNVLLKVIMCPLAVMISGWIFPNIEFANVYQPIIVGLVIAGAGLLMEFLLLKRGTLWISTFMDFAAAVLIVYYATNLFQDASTTFLGAVLTALIIAVFEHFVHLWLIGSGRAEKA